jgi:multidrug efflux pump subunit AcrA (membrane-fusion protein)
MHSMVPSRRRAASSTVVGLSLIAAAVVAASGGIYWWAQHNDSTDSVDALLHTVRRDNFELTVTERGEIESFDVVEVRSLVKSNNTAGTAILRIVPEGTEVKAGDFLIELDSSALESERTTQLIAVNTAQAAEIEAHSNYDTALIAEREYLDGTYLQERQTIESEVFVAEENLNRAKEYYAYSQELSRKGYVNELQLEADRFAVEKANKDLDTARTKLKVLDEYTKPKMLTTLKGATQIAKAKWEAAQNSYKLEQEKLTDIQDQIDKCMILAPQAGVVKYAHENDRRGDQEFIVEEGAIIRERQTIIQLPNAESMQVKLTINESLIRYIQPGLPARISPVGAGDRVLRGTVSKVNQYPEATGWRRANVKEYLAFVSVDEPAPELRSGLTASVTIQAAQVPSALQVPVQAIYAHGERMYCFAYGDGRWEPREVKPGPTNDKFFVIENGLAEGDRVALNPRAYVNEVKLPELSPEEKQRAVRIGSSGIMEEKPSDEMGPPPDGRQDRSGVRRGRRGSGGRGGAGLRGTEPSAPAVDSQPSAGAAG